MVYLLLALVALASLVLAGTALYCYKAATTNLGYCLGFEEQVQDLTDITNFLEGRDADMMNIINDLEGDKETLQASFDELKEDINMVAERRAKWRARAEAAEKDLALTQDQTDYWYRETIELEQAVGEHMADRQALKLQALEAKGDLMLCETELEGTLETLERTRQGYRNAFEALQKIISMIENPTPENLEILVGYALPSADQAVELVSKGMQDFVALVNERQALLQAVEGVQDLTAEGTEVPPANLNDPYGLNLPF